MLPIVDKPLIQYAVEEALAAGAERARVRDRLVASAPSRTTSTPTRARGGSWRSTASTTCSQLVRAHRPAGGAPASTSARASRSASATRCCARSRLVGDEPFFVHPRRRSDLQRGAGCLKQMAPALRRTRQRACSASRTVPQDQTGSYGIVAVEPDGNGAMRVTHIVEKPKPADAPSNARRRRPLHPDAGDFREARAHAARRRAARSS